jgi:hypothetical protein
MEPSKAKLRVLKSASEMAILTSVTPPKAQLRPTRSNFESPDLLNRQDVVRDEPVASPYHGSGHRALATATPGDQRDRSVADGDPGSVQRDEPTALQPVRQHRPKEERLEIDGSDGAPKAGDTVVGDQKVDAYSETQRLTLGQFKDTHLPGTGRARRRRIDQPGPPPVDLRGGLLRPQKSESRNVLEHRAEPVDEGELGDQVETEDGAGGLGDERRSPRSFQRHRKCVHTLHEPYD